MEFELVLISWESPGLRGMLYCRIRRRLGKEQGSFDQVGLLELCLRTRNTKGVVTVDLFGMEREFGLFDGGLNGRKGVGPMRIVLLRRSARGHYVRSRLVGGAKGERRWAI